MFVTFETRTLRFYTSLGLLEDCDWEGAIFSMTYGCRDIHQVFAEFIGLFTVGSAIAFSTISANAQITPDTSLGAESSVITPIDTQRDRIDVGAIRGNNLFHSFQAIKLQALA